MATVSRLPYERPRKIVKYGKGKTGTSWNVNAFETWLDDNDNTITPPPPPGTLPRGTSMKETYVAQTPTRRVRKANGRVEESLTVKRAPLGSVTSRKKEHSKDAFDVPSSDDEMECELVIRQSTPPKPRVRPVLVDDGRSKGNLAPWERKREQKSKVVKDEEVARRVLSARKSGQPPEPLVAKRESFGQQARDIAPTMPPMTAAARLAARREQVAAMSKPGMASSKRAAGSEDANIAVHRKRFRSEDPAQVHEAVTHVSNGSVGGLPAETVSMALAPPHEVDVWTIPDDDEPPFRPSTRLQQFNMKLHQPGLPPATRSTPMKGVSAPARLATMLPVDSDTSDLTPSTPSVNTSETSTPRRSTTPAKAPSMGTPRQSQLWSQLLSDHPRAPTPTSLKLEGLTISGTRRAASQSGPLARTLTKPKSDMPEIHRRRARVIDRLRAARESSSSDAEESASELGITDVVVNPSTGVGGRVVDLRQVPSDTSQHLSQSNSQPLLAGPKVTYGQERSHLCEENMEDSIFMQFAPPDLETTHTLGNTSSKSVAGSQKSALDMDESDDDGTTSRMRSVHELRAAGRGKRFMEETESLLEEIANHNANGRSRRRSALIELATKLKDKAYAERFVGHGMAQKLVAESVAPPDVIAEVVLASAFALIIAHGPPEHTFASIKAGGAITWLAGMLDQTSDIVTLAKDRKSNMTKAAQGSFVDFMTSLRSGDLSVETDAPLTPRIISLAVLEKLVVQLRALGDRTELLDAESLKGAIPVQAHLNLNQIMEEIVLAISLLESLASCTLPLNWSTDLLRELASLLPAIASNPDMPDHTLFLLLRLTLNLTNNNARNCEIFAQLDTITYLLTAIESGFGLLNQTSSLSHLEYQAEQKEEDALKYDLLVLNLANTINLFEHSTLARRFSSTSPAVLPITSSLIETLRRAQTQIHEAETLPETKSNIAYGYLAVMLANLCLGTEGRKLVTSRLSVVCESEGQGKKGLGLLVDAVQEFVRQHERLDQIGRGVAPAAAAAIGFEGAEGREVVGAFTGRLRDVLARLRKVGDAQQEEKS